MRMCRNLRLRRFTRESAKGYDGSPLIHRLRSCDRLTVSKPSSAPGSVSNDTSRCSTLGARSLPKAKTSRSHDLAQAREAQRISQLERNRDDREVRVKLVEDLEALDAVEPGQSARQDVEVGGEDAPDGESSEPPQRCRPDELFGLAKENAGLAADAIEGEGLDLVGELGEGCAREGICPVGHSGAGVTLDGAQRRQAQVDLGSGVQVFDRGFAQLERADAAKDVGREGAELHDGRGQSSAGDVRQFLRRTSASPRRATEGGRGGSACRDAGG